jgi:hypothetical protein
VAGVGCATLADHLRAVAWPSKFWPHLPEKYDLFTNPSEFLQVYITAITAARGNDAVMASYFHVALIGSAWTWLMNLTPGSIQSWGELCALFSVNFASAYQQHGVEAHLHAVRQQPGEILRAFISCFTKVCRTIPRISDASIIMAFRQGVRDEKMLDKLATHQVETITTLFALWTSAPGLLRAVHVTQPLKKGPPRRGAPVSLPLAAARRRTRRIAEQTSCRLELQSLQWQRPGARTRMAKVRASSVVTLGHALFILEPVTAPPNVARS